MKIHGFQAVLLGVLSLSLAGAPLKASAGIKCWTNKEGVRECGRTVPPEYAQKGYTERSGSGIKVIKVDRAKTADELEQERVEAAKKAEEDARLAEEENQRKKQRAEQLRADQVLLRTYTSTDELKIALDSKSAAIQSNIQLKRGQVAKREATLKKLLDQAVREERGGKGVSDKLKNDIARVQRQIEKNLQFIKDQEDEQVALTEQYEKNKARFLSLESGEIKPGDTE